MKFENYIEEFNLKSEKNAKAASHDLSKFEVSLSKGVLSINRAVATELGLDKNSYIELYTGKQGDAVIIGVRGGADKDWETAVKVKVLKTKPTKINISKLLLKHKLSTNKDYTINLVDCGEGYLVFAIIDTTKYPSPQSTKFIV